MDAQFWPVVYIGYFNLKNYLFEDFSDWILEKKKFQIFTYSGGYNFSTHLKIFIFKKLKRFDKY